MQLPSEVFLFNFSILSITFSAVAALMTLLRQTMGGKLSNFDVYLVIVYVSRGFALALASILPSLIAEFELSIELVWIISSVATACVLAQRLVASMLQRRRATTIAMALPTLASWVLNWCAVLLLIANAVLPAMRGAALYEAALSLALATIMWTFVRRVSTLLSDRPTEDWDPSRG